MYAVRIGGVWAHSLGPVGGLKWSESVYGPKDAAFTIALPKNFTHPALVRGALVELFDCGLRFWRGVLTQPNVAEWTFEAQGVAQRLADTVALVSNPRAAATAAAGRGWPIIVDPSLPDTPLSTASDDTSQLNTLSALLNQLERNTGDRWGVDEDGRLYVAPDSTEVRWHIAPGVPSMAVADDDYFSSRFGRYVSDITPGTVDVPSVPSEWDHAEATNPDDTERWGPRETIDDLTSYGVLTGTVATAVERQLLTEAAARPTFVQSLDLSLSQVTAAGSPVPARASHVRARHLVRHHGVYDVDGRYNIGSAFEWLIGDVSYDTASPDRIGLAPVGLRERTPSGVAEEIARAGAKAFT